MSGVQNISQPNTTVIVNGNQVRAEQTSEQPVELKNGSTIQGTVLSIVDSDGSKTVSVGVGDNVISAKLQEGMGLREGQTLNFAVKALSPNNISITPLYENTSVDQSTIKALTAAGLELNNDNIQMVRDMMEHSLPIDRQSLNEMSKNLMAFPNASISSMVEMKSLGIPITENNLNQFESYKNYEHQVVGEMQNIIDELPAAFDALSQSGNESAALNLYGQVLKMFGEEAVLQENAALQENTAAEETAMAQEDAVLNKAGEPKEIAQTVINTENDTSELSGISKDFVNTLKTINVPESAIDKYSQALKTGDTTDAAKQLLNELSKAYGEADFSNSAENSAWKKLFSSDEYNKILKENISSQWLLKPDDVENKENIENLYQRLGKQVAHLAETINSTAGAESKLGQAANNLQNNLDFMNQLNQMFQYVQLPLQMTGQNAHGDLYVYRNKNRKMSEDGSVSAVLHLDMENLGPIDVYVKMLEKKVSTNFYVADDSILDLINDNIHILNERLEKRGYTMQATMKLHDDMDGQDAAVDEMLTASKTPILSTASFDARA